MGDGGIGQQALDVLLKQRQEIAEEHGGHGDDAQHRHYRVVVQETAVPAVTEQQRHHGALGDRGQIGCHRGGGTLVDVRRPHVERHHRQLETGADHHHAESPEQQQGRLPCLAGQHRGHGGEIHGAEVRVDERHAEEQKGRGSRRQDQVLDAGLERGPGGAEIGHQAVEGDAQDLQPEEKRNEVIAGGQHRATEGGQREQQVELFPIPRHALQVAVRHHHHHHGRRREQADVEERVRVHGQQRSHRRPRVPPRAGQDRQRQRQAGQGKHHGEPVAAPERDHQHEHQRCQPQQDDGRQRAEQIHGRLPPTGDMDTTVPGWCPFSTWERGAAARALSADWRIGANAFPDVVNTGCG